MGELNSRQFFSSRKSGEEKINGIGDTKLLEFWQWAFSNVMSNAERGVFAEWLVAKAVGAADKTRVEWDKCDIITSDGLKIEVKSSGYLQSWSQSKLSNIIFSVGETRGWDSENNTYESEKKRQADIYVFCVHKHQEISTANPLDISQWDFYVIRTDKLNENLKSQKTVSLSKLIKIGAVLSDYHNLKGTIYEMKNNVCCKL